MTRGKLRNGNFEFLTSPLPCLADFDILYIHFYPQTGEAEK
jgi:hypothetical protein